MEIVKERIIKIIDNYNLKPIQLTDGHKNVYTYINEHNSRDVQFRPEITDNFLNKKYKKHIPRGWYGFDVGTPIVPDWMKIIDEITELCVSIDPNFEIHQVKLKYGRICYYATSNIIEDVFDIDFLLNDYLYDAALVY